MPKKPKGWKPKVSWFRDHRSGLFKMAKDFGMPDPTDHDLMKMCQPFTALVAHRADKGHWPDYADIAQRCYTCNQKLTDEEVETAKKSVDTGSFLKPSESFDAAPFFGGPDNPPAPPEVRRDGGSLEKLHAELAELTHRLGIVTRKIADAVKVLD